MKTISIAFCFLSLFTLASCIGEFDNEPPDMQVLRESRPLGSAKEFSVHLKYDVGQLDIMKISDDNLFSIDLQYNKRKYDPTFSFSEGDHASMRLDMNSNNRIGGRGRRDSELTVRLNEKVTLDLDVATGVSESHLDMTGLKVRRMRLHGGVGKTEVTFDKP